MEKKVLVILILSLFVVSFISAAATEIQIKTMPYHEVQASAYKPNSASFQILEQFVGNSNQYGDVYWDFETDEDEFNLVVFIKTLTHEKVTSKKYEKEYEAGGEDVYIELAPKDFEFIYVPEDLVLGDENISEIEGVLVDLNNSGDLEELVEEEDPASVPITGGAIFGEGGVVSFKMLYWALGIIGGLLIIFVVVWIILRKKGSGNKEIKVRKLSELKGQKQVEAQESEELKSAEAELRQAQSKISALKNKDKIDELQKELQQKQKEIEALRGGSGQQ